ncbi:MAG: hypothetical protein ABJG47_14510 [Ekhidna sp.]
MKGKKTFSKLLAVCFVVGAFLTSCGSDDNSAVVKNIDGYMFALLRDINEDGTTATTDTHPYAVMDFNPYSEDFGAIINQKEGQLGHHAYISPVNGQIYVSLADDMARRVHVQVTDGTPVVHHLETPLADEGMRVGEDIFWFKENGQDRFAVTSLAGDDSESNGGGIVVYNANTDAVVRVIKDGHKYTHGISMLDNSTTALVTEVIHEDIAISGSPAVIAENIGQFARLVDLATGSTIESYDLGTIPAGPIAGFGVSPVESLILRGSIHPAFEGNEKALVMNMLAGDIRVADWNDTDGKFGEFTSKFSPGASDSWGYFGLEFYATNDSDEADGKAKLYVTYAQKVITFDLATLANTGELVKTSVEFDTKTCAHHLAFYDVTNPETGETVPVLIVQQNLLNLGQEAFNTPFPLDISLGSHEVTAFNRATGEQIKTVNIQAKHGYGIEFVGGLDEDAYPHHH